jgi:hypothetical protein
MVVGVLAGAVVPAEVAVPVPVPPAPVPAPPAPALPPVLVLLLPAAPGCLPEALEPAASSTRSSPASPPPPPPHPTAAVPATATATARNNDRAPLPNLELVFCITPSYEGDDPTGRSFSNLVRMEKLVRDASPRNLARDS